MDRSRQWIKDYSCGINFDRRESDFLSDEESQTEISMDTVLPDDLLERILANLPVPSIFRAGCVCKRWKEIVTSKRFLWNCSHAVAQKPWYFMFTSYDEPVGYAYYSSLRKWYGIDLPDFVTSNWFTASSCGLVCFMNNDNRSELHVCNPIAGRCKRLADAPDVKFSDYSTLAISVDRLSSAYSIAVVKSKQVPDDFFQWDLSIVVYDSKLMMWVNLLTELLTGWRSGSESVICDGALYFLIYFTGAGIPVSRHGLIRYDLSDRSSNRLLMEKFIPVPCSLTCGRLMNLKERLVMVGGIGKQDRMDIIKGIGIWVLCRNEWQEVARMPHKYFQGFGEFDDVFASSGMDDLIYIQSYGAPHLLVFDMNRKQWRWAQKCPVTKRFPLQLFTGFCFEPRLESIP